MFDYALGGKDNYQVDRDASEMIKDALPTVLDALRENRQFTRRAVRHLLAMGVRQFLDLGCGMPGRGNVHDLAREADPSATVVYVDNDPVVINHFQALLSSSPVACALQLDIRNPRDILTHASVTKLIDFDRPVGVMVTSVLHYIKDEDAPATLMSAYMAALPPGSHLVLSHYHPEGLPIFEQEQAAKFADSLDFTMEARSPAEIAAFFDGLELLEPGLVPPPLWRPDRPQRNATGWLLAGVGVKGSGGPAQVGEDVG